MNDYSESMLSTYDITWTCFFPRARGRQYLIKPALYVIIPTLAVFILGRLTVDSSWWWLPALGASLINCAFILLGFSLRFRTYRNTLVLRNGRVRFRSYIPIASLWFATSAWLILALCAIFLGIKKSEFFDSDVLMLFYVLIPIPLITLASTFYANNSWTLRLDDQASSWIGSFLLDIAQYQPPNAEALHPSKEKTLDWMLSASLTFSGSGSTIKIPVSWMQLEPNLLASVVQQLISDPHLRKWFSESNEIHFVDVPKFYDRLALHRGEKRAITAIRTR